MYYILYLLKNNVIYIAKIRLYEIILLKIKKKL